MKITSVIQAFVFVIALYSGAASADQTLQVKFSIVASKTSGGNGHAQIGDQTLPPISSPYGSTCTEYLSGNMAKVVMPGKIDIIDLHRNTCIVLLPESHEMYRTAASAGRKASAVRATYVATGKTKKILGYEAHQFNVTGKSPTTTVTGFRWIAPSLPAAPELPTSSPIQGERGSEARGELLESHSIIYSARREIEVSMDYTVVSISTAKIPASTFAIPSGYKTIPAPTGAAH